MAENSTISAFPTGEGPGVRAASGRKAPNPYVQVALTYLRRPFSSPQGWAVSVLFLIMCIGFFPIPLSGDRHDIAAAPIRMPLMLAMALFAMFTLHVKSQFADSRARLTPGFHRVHATVAATIALLLVVLPPTVLIWLADLRSVGLVALMVFLFGAILCFVALHSRLWSWLIVLGCFATYTESARILLWQLLSGKVEAGAFALLALGAAIALLGGIRLVCLNEDMPAYHPLMRAGWARQYQTSAEVLAGAGILPLALRERFMENNMARWTNHARRASTSRWSAVCRWRVGMPNGWTSWLFGVGVVLAVQFAAWIAAGGRPEPSAFFWLTFVVWLIACPSFMSLSQLERQNYPLGYEIMLPVDRRTYLKQVGMAVAISCLRKWGGMYAAFMLWWIMAAPEPLRFGLVVNVLACSALAQVGLFGIGLCVTWLAKRDSSSQIMVPLVVGAIWGVFILPIIMVGFMLNESPLPGLGNFLLPLAGAALFAMFGLLLTWLVYRRWLVADFD